jgi:hypothetical protein
MNTFKIVFLSMVAASVIGLVGSIALATASYVSDGRYIWFLARSSGLVAYALLSFAMIWGLLTSSRVLMKWIKLPLTSEIHQALSVISLAVIALHGWVLLYDAEFGFTLADLLVPFAAPYKPVAVAAGIAAGYLTLVITVSFYVRSLLGQRFWRILHYGTFGLFLLALAHGIAAGSDSSSLAGGLLYIGTGSAALFLTYVRILGGRYIPARRQAPAPAQHQSSHVGPDRTGS